MAGECLLAYSLPNIHRSRRIITAGFFLGIPRLASYVEHLSTLPPELPNPQDAPPPKQNDSR